MRITFQLLQVSGWDNNLGYLAYKSVASPCDGLDKARLFGIVLEDLADFPDRSIDCVIGIKEDVLAQSFSMISSRVTNWPRRSISRNRTSMGIRSSFSVRPERRNWYARRSSSNSSNLTRSAATVELSTHEAVILHPFLDGQ